MDAHTFMMQESDDEPLEESPEESPEESQSTLPPLDIEAIFHPPENFNMFAAAAPTIATPQPKAHFSALSNARVIEVPDRFECLRHLPSS